MELENAKYKSASVYANSYLTRTIRNEANLHEQSEMKQITPYMASEWSADNQIQSLQLKFFIRKHFDN